MIPVDALREIGFLLERVPRRHLPGKAYRRRPNRRRR